MLIKKSLIISKEKLSFIYKYLISAICLRTFGDVASFQCKVNGSWSSLIVIKLKQKALLHFNIEKNKEKHRDWQVLLMVLTKTSIKVTEKKCCSWLMAQNVIQINVFVSFFLFLFRFFICFFFISLYLLPCLNGFLLLFGFLISSLFVLFDVFYGKVDPEVQEDVGIGGRGFRNRRQFISRDISKR